MTVKSGEKLMWGTAAVFLLTRVLQYIFVIDQDGFFIQQNILSNLLYILFGVFALLSLFVGFSKKNQKESCAELLCSRSVAWVSLIAGLSLMVYAAVLAFHNDWLYLPALAAMVYFILLHFYASGKDMPVMKFMVVGALGYPCCRAIQMFFDTFKEIKASENVIDMVAICAMILMVLSLTKLCMGFEEKTGKVAWSFLVMGAFGALSGIGKLLGLIWGALDMVSIVAAVSDLMMWCLALVVYHRLALFRTSEIQDEVDV